METRLQLKGLRQLRGLSRKQVADAAGISLSYYGLIEQGARQPALDTAKKLADLFGRSVDELFFNDTIATNSSM
jgi:putative transcriptional regulator